MRAQSPTLLSTYTGHAQEAIVAERHSDTVPIKTLSGEQCMGLLLSGADPAGSRGCSSTPLTWKNYLSVSHSLAD